MSKEKSELAVYRLILKGALSELSEEDRQEFDDAKARMLALYDELEAKEEGLGALTLSYVMIEKGHELI
jgi:hypothetical protein